MDEILGRILDLKKKRVTAVGMEAYLEVPHGSFQIGNAEKDGLATNTWLRYRTD